MAEFQCGIWMLAPRGRRRYELRVFDFATSNCARTAENAQARPGSRGEATPRRRPEAGLKGASRSFGPRAGRGADGGIDCDRHSPLLSLTDVRRGASREGGVWALSSSYPEGRLM